MTEFFSGVKTRRRNQANQLQSASVSYLHCLPCGSDVIPEADETCLQLEVNRNGGAPNTTNQRNSANNRNNKGTLSIKREEKQLRQDVSDKDDDNDCKDRSSLTRLHQNLSRSAGSKERTRPRRWKELVDKEKPQKYLGADTKQVSQITAKYFF